MVTLPAMDPVHSSAVAERTFTKISLRLYDDDPKLNRALHVAIREALSNPHLPATDTDAAKFIYERGLAAAAAELGIKPAKPAKKAAPR
jgi:hypothetical protein